MKGRAGQGVEGPAVCSLAAQDAVPQVACIAHLHRQRRSEERKNRMAVVHARFCVAGTRSQHM